jgi:acetyl-CoA acetyltransferase
MRMNAYIAGIGMTNFGNHIQTPLKGLASQAITLALQDAGIDPGDLHAAYMANAAGGLKTDTAAAVMTLLQREELN